MKGWLSCVGILLAGSLFCFAQPFGLSNRVANATLRLPPTPPVFGYTLTNAFGGLTFQNPLAIGSPPG